MASVVRAVLKGIKDKGVGGFMRELREEGYLSVLFLFLPSILPPLRIVSNPTLVSSFFYAIYSVLFDLIVVICTLNIYVFERLSTVMLRSDLFFVCANWKCLPDGNLLQTKIHNIGATLVGVDKAGNKYYEKLDTQSGRHRWVEYAEKGRYNASQVPPEWHGWLHYITDRTGDEGMHSTQDRGIGPATSPGNLQSPKYFPKHARGGRSQESVLPLSSLVELEHPNKMAPATRRDVTASEIENARQPLINGGSHSESYSVSAAVLPFLFPALGGLLYGYDIGATSGAEISLMSSTLSGTTWYDLSSVQLGLVVSGSLYGALIGSALAFIVADILGRRRELILSSVLYFAGALLTALAPNFFVMVVGRFVYGTGIGLAMHAAPMYIAETSPTQIRGRLISLKEFFIVFGMLLGYISGSVYVDLVGGWRYMYATSSPICLIMGIGMWWLPQSPRWLLLCAIQGNGNLTNAKEFAIACLCRLRGPAFDSSASEQVDLILDELSYIGQEKQASFMEIFQGKCRKALIIGAGLVFFQQVTGQPSVLYYAATILQSAGFSAASDATRVSILLGLLKVK
ncbi:D-xylose-proton symporter-like 2 [Canna indica]|uniref:D-xylose-proton symporter-like 2 n=1 Tax=Canna indica TaxID=4628 RepID=A0AAQ3KKB8_9LILI|nr:D-xylose-proton symporter-like 2 [Canna indica]